MNPQDQAPCRSLQEIEAQVEVEMREYGRRRLQEELQKEADRHGQIFPPQRSARPTGAAADDASAKHRGHR